MSYPFTNFDIQREKCNSLESIPMEEALGLLDMVCKDMLNAGSAIEELPIRDWNRLRMFMLSLTGTLNRIYKKHSVSISEKVRPIKPESQAALKDAEDRLHDLEDQETQIQRQLQQLQSVLDKQQTKADLIQELLTQKQEVEEHIRLLQSVDLPKLEQTRDQLTQSAAALKDQITRQQAQNQEVSKKLAADRALLLDETRQETDLLKDLEEVRTNYSSRRDSCQKLQTEKDALLGQLSGLNQTQAQLETACKELPSQIQAALESKKAVLARCTQLQEKLHRAQTDLSAAETQRDILQQKLDNDQRRKEQLDQECIDLQNRQNQLQTELITAKQTLADARTKAKQTQAELDQAKDDYQQIGDSILNLGRVLQQQLEANTDYRDSYLVPAQAALTDKQNALQTMKDTLQKLNDQLKALEKENTELVKETNQTNTLINGQILTKEERDKELKKAKKELEDKLRSAQQEQTANQATLDKMKKELNDLTEGVIQPTLDAIAEAEEKLRKMGSKEVLREYEQIEKAKQSLVDETEKKLAQLLPLKKELAQCEADRDIAQKELDATNASIQQTKSNHDRIRRELEFLNSESESRSLQQCQQRLESMTMIRQNLIEITRDAGFEMAYTDVLQEAIAQSVGVLARLRAEILRYSDLFSKKVDQ